ncbi:MAG: hypothetical protein KJ956_06075 [Actinobacteria bacterium]|nr:hypothetical protein [Actinomycetota bacterium]
MLAAVLVLGTAVPALGNDFGYPGNHAANNGVHEVYRSIYLTYNISNDTGYVVSYVLNPLPDITAYTTTTYSNYVNDVQVYEGTYGDLGGYAAAPCSPYARYGGSGTGTWCKPRYVKYDTGTHPSAFNTYQERRHFACHELGHTLGLFHRNSGYCLDVSGVSYTLSPHNQNHLSDLYG